MLTNERLKEIKGNPLALKSMTEAEQLKIIDELLTLREAVAPQMAEVDVLLKEWSSHSSNLSVEQVIWSDRMFSALRRAIASEESQRKRAEDAENNCEMYEAMKEGFAERASELESQITTLAAEAEQLRMAIGCATTIKGDMVMRADDPLGMMQEVCQYVATLTAERDELERLLKWIVGKDKEVLLYLSTCNNPGSVADASKILAICSKEADNA